MTFGEILRATRKRLGKRQKELAGEVEVSIQAWNNWETGHHLPGKNCLRKILALPYFSDAEKLTLIRTFVGLD